MHHATTLPVPEETCIWGDCATLFVSLELSRSTWVATALAPGSRKMSKHTLVGGLDARRALRASGDDADALGRAAYVLGYFGDDLEAAIALIDRSLELNPSSADGWRWSGWMRLWAGHPDLAVKHFETGLRLNPREPSPATLMRIGVGHFFARRFEEARAMLLRSLQVQ